MFLALSRLNKALTVAAVAGSLCGCGKTLMRRDALGSGFGGNSNTTTNVGSQRGALTEIDLNDFSSPDAGVQFDPILKVLAMNGQSSTNLEGKASSPLLDMTDQTLIALSVIPLQPYNKELPANNGSDAGYPTGNLSAADMVGYWRLNESSSPYMDSSKNSRNGTSGTPPTAAPGILRTAQRFNGTTAVIQVNADADNVDTLNLARYGVGTWMAWFNNDTPANGSSLVRKGSDGNYAITYSTSGTGASATSTVNCEISNGSLASNKKIVSAGVPKVAAAGTNPWHHIACVYDGASLKLYLDSLLIGSVNAGAGSLTSTGIAKHFYIGANGATGRYKGTIDEVAVYKRALPREEIENIYHRAEIFGVQYRAAASPSELESKPFIGPDGGASSYYLPAYVDSNGPPIFQVPPQNGMYVQVRTRFAMLSSSSRIVIKQVQPIFAPH